MFELPRDSSTTLAGQVAGRETVKSILSPVSEHEITPNSRVDGSFLSTLASNQALLQRAAPRESNRLFTVQVSVRVGTSKQLLLVDRT